MPMLPDPKLDLFKAYHAFDDFESQPLHGTFLIDAQGNVRFQRISAEPFLDVDFLKAEAGADQPAVTSEGAPSRYLMALASASHDSASSNGTGRSSHPGCRLGDA